MKHQKVTRKRKTGWQVLYDKGMFCGLVLKGFAMHSRLTCLMFSVICLTVIDSTLAAGASLSGRWSAGLNDSVGVLTIEDSGACNWQVWTDAEYAGGWACEVEEIVFDDKGKPDVTPIFDWSLAQSVAVNLDRWKEGVRLEAFLYHHPTQDDVLWVEEPIDGVFAEVWHRLPDTREMLRAGLGVSPRLPQSQRACAVEVISNLTTDDMLDLMYGVLPERFENEGDVWEQSLDLEAELEKDCGIRAGAIQLGF